MRQHGGDRGGETGHQRDEVAEADRSEAAADADENRGEQQIGALGDRDAPDAQFETATAFTKGHTRQGATDVHAPNGFGLRSELLASKDNERKELRGTP